MKFPVESCSVYDNSTSWKLHLILKISSLGRISSFSPSSYLMATRRTGLTNQERTPLIARRPQQQKRHDPYSPISHDLDKEDRRSILGRVASSAMASLSTRLWPKFVPNNDAFNNETSPRSCSPDSDLIASHHLPQEDGYYEDSYNDLPWRCSFGTREDVSTIFSFDCSSTPRCVGIDKCWRRTSITKKLSWKIISH